MILTFVAAIEASLIFLSWSRRSRIRRHEILLGGIPEIKGLPILDRYLKQQTGMPTKLQIIAAQKVSSAFRKAVHTKAFEYVVLRMIQSVVTRTRRKSKMSKVEVVL
jgi:hypothetical protein